MTSYSLAVVLGAGVPSHGNWQGVARNQVTGEWFMAHSKKASNGGVDDGIFYRFFPNGVYRDKMVIPNLGHIYGFGVSDTNILWFTWDIGSSKYVVTMDYRAGKTIRSRSAATPMHTFSDNSTQVSFSPSRDYLVVMEDLGNRRAFTQRAKADVLSNTDRKVGQEIVIPDSAGTLQGFSLVDGFLLLLFGAPERKAWIEWWDFATGDKTKSLDITSAGTEGKKLSQREPEGMDGRYFSIKIEGGAARRMMVYKLEDDLLASVKSSRKSRA